MTEPGFQVETVQHGIPFRSRAAYAGYQEFGDRESAVLVDAVTAVALRTAAERAFPRETGGLLSGRVLRDSDGRYVLVAGFVEAPADSGRRAAFDVSPRETARMREESARSQPTADVVGWWHSHLEPSRYSQTDLASQSVWKQPQSVGLLVFAAGEPWATVYLGPDARHLGDPASALRPRADWPGPERRPADRRASADDQADMPASPVIADPRWKPVRRPYTWSPRRLKGLLRLAVIILALVAIGLLAVVYGLSSQLRTGEQALSRQLSSSQHRLAGQLTTGQALLGSQLRRALTSLDAPPIGSACAPVPPPATAGAYRCTARSPGARGTIEWRLDGKPSGAGPSVVIRVPLDGRTHQILALLRTPGGTYPGMAENISLPAAPAGRSGRPGTRSHRLPTPHG